MDGHSGDQGPGPRTALWRRRGGEPVQAEDLAQMTPRFRMGFLVNPIAGLGGRPGLKGSDDADAVRRIAETIEVEEIPAYARALDFLTDLILKNGVAVAAPGPLGEGVLKKAMSCGGPIFEIVREVAWSKRFGQTTRED